ncbi:MAG TPA: glucose-6-phosphate dehydrogenase assembly protein OpcA [Opitutaceae bacterium]|jgi:glucose-6-phosphate dehydrogenase assembly protein OpcA
MAAIFDALPGLDTPVSTIGPSLAAMWRTTEAQGKPAPPTEDAKATQVNFVLHLGANTTPDDAQEQFDIAVKFSRRYPSRVVVLCSDHDDKKTAEIRAKVYGECTLGKSKSDTRCCEFVMLSYTVSARPFLESQVSVCLSTDLPLYYWAHGFSASTRLADYHYLLTRSKRVLIDSATAPADALTYPWPRPEVVRDLAFARVLHVRQSVGQFLSRYPMDAICEDLQSVEVSAGAELTAEGRVVLAWLKDRVGACGKNQATFTIAAGAANQPRGMAIKFRYSGAKTFAWEGNAATGTALFTADFGTGKTTLPATVALLQPENALSEAMFF